MGIRSPCIFDHNTVAESKTVPFTALGNWTSFFPWNLSNFHLWFYVRKFRTFYMLQKYFLSGFNTVFMKILCQLWGKILAPYLTHTKGSAVSSLCANVASSLWNSNMTRSTILYSVKHWCTCTLGKWPKLHVTSQILLQHEKERSKKIWRKV